ncbi:MAG: protein-L-isoaspartate(D-aspartate) O-methyltransferase [Bryobacterales bacterium]|nr:protein-L-isoaspartate(D-aspartate) O-methyltransferase [Bryobacteraceae bacterium]MDW8131894.1 protein-L-isoaspartate(D-aspartate) O-methyltransferase [Bryobacterales bacterium]
MRRAGATIAVLAAAIAWATQKREPSRDPWAAARERMVREQIEERGVRHPDVLRVMRQTPRHLFLPERLRSQAYEDHPVPIGYGQTISQPYIVALMTELLEPHRDAKVLEIGTGSGYQAAVLAPLVRHVYTIEIVRELAESAAELLKKLGYHNVTVRWGDGYLGWPEEAPFDRIIVTAAPPEVPKALLDQLKPGGKLVAPVGSSIFGQDLIVIEKTPDGKIRRRSVLPVMFVPMVKGRQP